MAEKTPLTLEPVALEDIPASVRSSSATHALLTEFVNSGAAAARIPVPEDRKADTVRGSLDSYIKRHSFPVRVQTRNRDIYLVRKDVTANGADAPTA